MKNFNLKESNLKIQDARTMIEEFKQKENKETSDRERVAEAWSIIDKEEHKQIRWAIFKELLWFPVYLIVFFLLCLGFLHLETFQGAIENEIFFLIVTPFIISGLFFMTKLLAFALAPIEVVLKTLLPIYLLVLVVFKIIQVCL